MINIICKEKQLQHAKTQTIMKIKGKHMDHSIDVHLNNNDVAIKNVLIDFYGEWIANIFNSISSEKKRT